MPNLLTSISDAVSQTVTGAKTLNIQTRYEILIVIAVLVVGYGFGKYGQPQKVVTKTDTVTKTVYVDHVNTVTVVKEVDKPDGEKDIDTTTTDTSVVDNNSTTTATTDKTVTNSKAQWRVEGLYGPQISSSTVGPVYGVGVERRILGPIWAGAEGTTDHRVSLKVGIEF